MTPSALVLVMGVSGAGKTTVAAALAERLGWDFLDADDLQPPVNVEKMRRGEPLDDQDRAPWLDAVAAWMDRRDAPSVVACSALKRAYRDRLRDGRPGFRLIYLRADPAVVAKRLEGRRGHFWPAPLLASQFDALEPPTADEAPITVDIGQTVEKITDQLAAQLG